MGSGPVWSGRYVRDVEIAGSNPASPTNGVRSSLEWTLRWGRRDREFNSRHPDQIYNIEPS